MTEARHPPIHPVIVAVVGATASGKTELSLDLAQRLDGEIVNTDAMQIYLGMDIGTAKLAEAHRRGIPHHMLDFATVRDPDVSVADFQRRARDAIADIRGRGRTPVLVGGSALYTRAILDRFEFPGTDVEVRRELEAELAAHGPGAMHRRLRELDPEAADRILIENGRRTVRALEVIRLTGRPFSASLPEMTYADPLTVQIGVDIDRPALDARIEQRVTEMFASGLLDEVRRLRRDGLADSRTASAAIGYREAIAVLDGQLTEEGARERTAARTRRFARRQDSWFRKDPRVQWVAFDDPRRLDAAHEVVRAAGDP